MSDLVFEKFPSIKRLKRNCVITEKIDGTNAQIVFSEHGSMLVGSRKRQITPEDDNYGFARWAYDNHRELFNVLGEGRHYGEWWGSKIGRRYGKSNGDKVFSLFNSGRWKEEDLLAIDQLSVVPVLFTGEFTTDAVDSTMDTLKETGSIAAPGFNKPEGIVVYHTRLKEMLKITFEHDDTGKPFGA